MRQQPVSSSPAAPPLEAYAGYQQCPTGPRPRPLLRRVQQRPNERDGQMESLLITQLARCADGGFKPARAKDKTSTMGGHLCLKAAGQTGKGERRAALRVSDALDTQRFSSMASPSVPHPAKKERFEKI